MCICYLHLSKRSLRVLLRASFGEVLSILIPHQHQHIVDFYPGRDKIWHRMFRITYVWMAVNQGNNCFKINDVRLEK